MALIVRHKPTDDTRRVQSMSDIQPREREQWEISEKVRSTPEEIFERHGTGLPPEARAIRDSRRRYG